MAEPALEQHYAAARHDPLLDCLAVITRLHGKPASTEALRAGLPGGPEAMTPTGFVAAAERHGYSARVLKHPLARISNLVLPAVLLLDDAGACVLTRIGRGRKAQVIFPESGFGAREVPIGDLKRRYAGFCVFLQPVPEPDLRIGDEPERPSTRLWFWRVIWRFKRYYAEAAIAASLVNVLVLATSLFIMNVYDRVVPNNAMETLVVLATGTAIAVGFEFLARTLRAYFIEVSARKADLLLASRLFGHALALRMDARPPSSGAFAAQLREFESLRDFITSATLTSLSDLPFVFFFIWVVYLLGGPLFMVPLLAVPLVIGVGLLAQVPLAYTMRRHLRETALRHGLLVEAVEGMETLKSLRAEGLMQQRWENYTALTGRTSASSRVISSFVVHFAGLAASLVTIGVVIWGVHLVAAGELSVGGLIACVIISGRAMSPLSQVASLLARYQHARMAYFTLDELMHRPVERPPGRRFLHRPEIRGSIEFRDVRFAYPGQKVDALAGVSFAANAGERIGILGRVGSGKSTLLKLLVSLHAPSSGVVLLDGTDLAQFDPVDVRRSVGYVAQEVRLFQGTVRDNVAMGVPWADDADVQRAARIAGLDQIVSQHPLGYDLQVGEGGTGLSGGQRQAVALARAILGAPQVLLLDEPTSAMDHNTEGALLARLKDFAKGRTVVLVTHRPTMLAIVDRLIVVEAGRIAADGPREEVLRVLTRSAAAPGRAPAG